MSTFILFFVDFYPQILLESLINKRLFGRNQEKVLLGLTHGK